MPNRYQLLFILTFVSTFILLLVVSRAITSTLGLDLSKLILIGLPKDPQHPEMGNYEFQDYVHIISNQVKNVTLDDFRAVEIPLLGTVDLVAMTQTTTFMITAGIFVATFIWTKIFHSGRTKSLDPKVWKEFPLEKKIKVSPNTSIYRFSLPRSHHTLGLPIGQHISVGAEINGKEIVRSYTPISNDDDRGYFDLLVKTYEKGNISRYLSLLKVGDRIRVKGPKGGFTYDPSLTQHIGMIAGGTGITPMFQIMKACLKNPFDKTTISLIYANVNEEDILLKDEIEVLLDLHDGSRLKVYYVLNNPPAGWKGGVGFVSREQIKEHLPNPLSQDCRILMCGPPPMVTAMKKHLDELKYPAPRTVSKLADKVFVF